MAYFQNQIRTILPVLGFDFLRAGAQASSSEGQPQPDTSPVFALSIPKHGIRASAREVEGEFVVLKDSLARHDWTGIGGGYQALFKQICDDGVLTPTAGGLRVFTTDLTFASPSAAAAVVSGRSANGRTAWAVEAGGPTYGVWQEQQVNQAEAVSGSSDD